MTGWTELGVLVWIVITVAALVAASLVVVTVVSVRHFARWSCDEHAETHDQRRTTPAPEHCWVSPDEELEFEEITAALRPGQVPPC